jgi:hypothetical protein
MGGVHLDSRRGQACSDLGVGASEVEEEFNLLRLHLCACATTVKPPRGIGGVGLGGCCQWDAPESFW